MRDDAVLRRALPLGRGLGQAAAEDSSVSTLFLCTVALVVDLAVICHLGHSKID